jgi:acetyltransferase-like isoleucine patch superfamily enzyme
MNKEHQILDIQEKMADEKVSALRKYQNLVVGKTGLGALLRYEFLHTFISGIPGALGLALRRLIYPCMLGRVGRNVAIGSHVTFRHPHKVFIGDNVVIDDHCLLDAKGDTNQGITIGSGVFIGRNTILHCKNGDIVIGDEANIGFNCDIASSNYVEIGAKVLIAAYSYIVGGGHDFSRTDVPIMDQERVAKGIRVGDHSWIGAGVTILDGVTVGSDAIIGTGAVVTDSLPEKSIAVGMPARVVRKRDAT